MGWKQESLGVLANGTKQWTGQRRHAGSFHSSVMPLGVVKKSFVRFCAGNELYTGSSDIVSDESGKPDSATSGRAVRLEPEDLPERTYGITIFPSRSAGSHRSRTRDNRCARFPQLCARGCGPRARTLPKTFRLRFAAMDGHVQSASG